MPKTIPRHRKSAYDAQNGLCWYCSRPMWLDQPETFAKTNSVSLKVARLFQCTAEHLQARTDGGGNSKDNIAAAASSRGE
jgi:5-methylcytosine-specific restriction endonuclease McrA